MHCAAAVQHESKLADSWRFARSEKQSNATGFTLLSEAAEAEPMKALPTANRITPEIAIS